MQTKKEIKRARAPDLPGLQENGNHLTNAAIAATTQQRLRYLRILQNALYAFVDTGSSAIYALTAPRTVAVQVRADMTTYA